jgi:ABC-2 type transport system ATP-binding protein
MAVRLSGLVKSYGKVRAVQGVDLDIAPGEVVALLGPNGAGKSTTIDMLLGLTMPDEGTASIFGNDPVRAVAAGDVGAMLQSGTLLPDVTVGELVETFAALHKRPLPVADALARAGIADLAKRATAKLSGGQAQRVRFALAVVPDPDLLVLDEPTVGMDVEARRAFWATMRELTASGRTVLFATHYLEEADDFADRIVLMRAGTIVADGSAAAIKGRVSGRTISAHVPNADRAALARLPGVAAVEVRGEQVRLSCRDSDRALRALLATHSDASEVEVRSVDLEDAFLALTTESTESTTESTDATDTEPTEAPSGRRQ